MADKEPIKRDRNKKYGRQSALQEAESFAKNSGLKTEPMFSKDQKSSLHLRNIVRNSKSVLERHTENRSFKLTPIQGGSLNVPFNPPNNINLPSNKISNSKPSAFSKLANMYDKLLDKVDTSTDQAIGGALGFTNRNVVPGFTQNTSSGLSKFDVGDGDPFKYSNRFTKGSLDDLEKAYINEAAKSVRVQGDNVSPFTNSKSARQLAMTRNLQNTIRGGQQDSLIRESNFIRSQLDSTTTLKPNTNPILMSPSGINKSKINYKGISSTRDSLLDRQSAVDRKIERNIGILSRGNDTKFANSKSFLPREGINGYGLGFNNYLNASRKELFTRGLGFTGGIVGASGSEALMNSFGIVTAKQRAYTQSKSLIGKMMTPGMQAPLMAYGSMLFTAASGGDLSDFVETQLSFAGGLQGWRMGSSFGGALTKGSATNFSHLKGGNMISAIQSQGKGAAIRGAAGLAGGLTGFALGVAAVSGASWLAQDITSNRSTIRKIAKDFTTKTATMNTQNTRQSLTMRQMAINKLAKSGLNDRATLLGNESRVLKGIM